MALFADKIGLVMGVANDRSIAWALSQALLRRRGRTGVHPSAQPHRRTPRPRTGRAARAQDRPALQRAKGRRHRAGVRYGPRRLRPARFPDPFDRLCPAARAAQAVHRDEPRRLAPGHGHQRLQPGGGLPGGRAADGRRRHDRHHQLLRRRESHPRLQRDGRVQGGVGAQRPLPGLGPRPAEDSRQLHQRRAGAHAERRAASPASTSCASTPCKSPRWPQHRRPRPRRTGLYLLSNLSSGVTGETIHVDCGYSIVGLWRRGIPGSIRVSYSPCPKFNSASMRCPSCLCGHSAGAIRIAVRKSDAASTRLWQRSRIRARMK